MEIYGELITEKLSDLKDLPSTWLQQQTKANTSCKGQPSAALLSSFSKSGDDIIMTDVGMEHALAYSYQTLGLSYWLSIPLERVFNLLVIVFFIY